MIDFRYHLVSLISVFLALAVGIVLGAGPLKEAIGDQLTGQVDALRADKEELRVALDDTESDLANRDAFLESMSGDLLAAALPGRRVAVIELEPVDDAILAGIEDHLVTAGARVTVRGELAESWTVEGQARFRQSLAGSLVQYLDPAPAQQSTDAELAYALTQSLTAVDPTDENAFSDRAAVLQELLAAGSLIDFDAYEEPADLIVLVSAPPEIDENSADAGAIADARANAVRIQTQLASAAQTSAEAAVVVGAAPEPNDLLAAVRDDADLSSLVSIVGDASELTSQLNVPLALAARATGTVGQFGPGLDAVAPPVVRLGQVDRSARTDAPDDAEPEDPAEDEGDAADDGATDGDATDGTDADAGEQGEG